MVTYLLILKVSEFGLNGVELITECEEVLIALLNLENLSLELRNEQILLV
jgi:hypothetical protein